MRADHSLEPESEFKLGAKKKFHVPQPPAAIHMTDANDVELTATYWDTADYRLTRNGMSLRYRSAKDNSENGWTLKLASPSNEAQDDKGLTSRIEVKLAGPAARPSEAAVCLLRGVTINATLVPVAELVTNRRQFDLLDVDDQVQAHVMDDHVYATPRSGPPLTFREIEVEVVGSNSDVAKRYVRRLRKAGAKKPVVGSKIEQVLRPLIPRSQRFSKKGRSNVEGLARTIVATALKELVLTDPLVRLGQGVEPVHRARVATRRLRSNLKSVAPLFDSEWLDFIAGELKWLGGIFGSVRDLDVLAAGFREALEPCSASTFVSRGASEIFGLLDSDRATAGRQLAEALDSDRYVALIALLDTACVKAPLAEGVDAGQRALPMLRRQADRALSGVSKAVKGVDADSTHVQLHRVRRRAKHARYSVQLAAPLAGKQATHLASKLGDLQETLGELQDAVVAEQWLSRVMLAYASPSLVQTVATLLATQHARLDQQHSAWRGAWKRTRRPKLHAWM